MQESNTYQTTEQRCRTVHDKREVPDGYRVTYVWHGETRSARMDHDPGRRIPVENGRLVIAPRDADSGRS